MVFQNDILAGSSGGTGTSSAVHTIGQSIRFNSGDSAYMHRTPSSTGNRKTFTSSFWFKRGKLGTDMYLGGPNISNSGYAYGIYFASDDSIYVWIYYSGSAWQGQLYTNRLFRDPSAWYHIVLSVDTTQAVSSERVRIYVNGQRETSFATENYPNQNQDTSWNVSGTQMSIGSGDTNPSASGAFFDGYLAEIHYLDGYAYDPSYFGLFNDSGIWIPKEYSGSYGTNGFHIKGESASDLGNDSSGNNNDFTTSGLASHDQVSDSPTNNFCVANPLIPSTVTYSEGNLKSVISANESTSATMGASSGKWYFEVYVNTVGSAYLGICSNQTTNFTSYIGQPEGVGCNASAGDIYISNTTPAYTSFEGLPTYTSGDIIGIAFDVDNQKMWWSKNGQWYSGNASSESTINISDVEAGNNAFDFSYINEQFIFPMLGTSSYASTTTSNFGQEGTFAGSTTAGGNSDANGIGNFKYSVPSGYLALCTKNLGS